MFTEDYVFKSLSAEAAIVVGNNMNSCLAFRFVVPPAFEGTRPASGAVSKVHLSLGASFRREPESDSLSGRRLEPKSFPL